MRKPCQFVTMVVLLRFNLFGSKLHSNTVHGTEQRGFLLVCLDFIAYILSLSVINELHDTENNKKYLLRTQGGHIRCISSTIRHMSKENGGRGGVYVGMSSISGKKQIIPKYHNLF
jgi:hypothetical protein